MSSNLVSLDFMPLENSGENYLSWALDADLHLEANKLGHTIIGRDCTSDERGRAVAYLRRHLSPTLKQEVAHCREPQKLWSTRKGKYDHFKVVTLPKICDQCIHLRFQDFKSVSAYNSELYKIAAQFKMCGEPLSEESKLEKTLSTFHASHIVLQQLYRERRFTRYSDLICCLLVDEQNNELLIKNYESRPCGFAPAPEVNRASYSGHGHDRGKQGYRGKKRKRGGYRHINANNHPYNKNAKAEQDKGKGSTSNSQKKYENPLKKNDEGCYCCGSKDHRYKCCRADLCEPHKKREANVEMNLAECNISTESPKLEVSDYLLDFEGNGYQTAFDQFADGLFSVN
ncbi:uncharacterized protein LOC113359248 [Papaver somniferum]|uniref:uncharacterized protein LOC113359248 n=1 Tax=Papaver somniferum TaxID=3469 RepID=UPI000E6F8740|nr:uncharacterized protein LOC113359248 [Papaver somniferum]